jgi:hypothetical protein
MTTSEKLDDASQRLAKRASNRPDDAEVDALIAIDYAYATVEEAEYAVLDAISARMEANDLAMT